VIWREDDDAEYLRQLTDTVRHVVNATETAVNINTDLTAGAVVYVGGTFIHVWKIIGLCIYLLLARLHIVQ